MSAAPTMCQNPCETCAKAGLPILLTRYALMPKEINAPKLAGNLDAADLKKVPLGSSAHYGLRLLRSGYVYVFDEKRKLWDEYFVTADSVLSKMPPRIRALKVQAKPATDFSCARNGAAPLAGVITIRNAKHAGNVWIAFSDVEWTDQVFLDHIKSEEHRKKHMKCVVVSGGKVAAQADTAPLKQIEQVVPEFKQGMGNRQFAKWCPHRYNARQGNAAALLKAAETIRPGGGAAIVALHDPVGLAMEIASLMEVRKVTFMNHDSVVKPRFAASTIASLEASIREQAKLGEIVGGEHLAKQAEAGPGAYNPNPALWGVPGDLEEAERWRTHTPQSLKQAASAAWKKYTHDRNGKPRFDAAGSQAWLKNYNEGFKKFDVEQIAPLAQAHVAWMKHPCMVSHLSCNYDSANKESGVAFTATVVELMRHTTDKQPSYDLYLKWLTAGEFTEENLVMRALGFNQKELIDKLKQADAAPVDGRAFPSDATAGAVAAFMEKMPAGANVQLTALLAGLSGPALKYWDDFNAGKAGSKAAAAMAAVSGKQFVRLPMVGNRGQFVQAYMAQMYALNPGLSTKPNEMQAAIAKQVKLLEIEGVKMNSKSKLGWYVILDKELLTGATRKNLTGQALADELAKAIRTPQDLKKLDMAKAARFRTAATGGATVLGGVFMALNFTKLLDDVETGMSHEVAEAKTKLMVGKIAIAGFVAEQLGSGLEKLGETRLRNMMGRAGAIAPEALKLFGRFAGFGTGVFLGLWDLSKGVDASNKGDVGLSRAYVVSGVAGISVASTLFLVAMGTITLGPIGWILVAAGVLIWLAATFFIETNKDNKRQEWLSRCHFGTAADKYPDTRTHVEQYKLALAE